ncbi:MAG TPA: IclR family transcriptional regulator [Paracoccaceae bacterium]|nr:IclR family transcriptional regulator [Paracoccaceae bacterium]
MTIETPKTGQRNQSVQRALQILRHLSLRGEPVGVREIARHFNYSPSIAQRLLSTMAEEGFVERTPDTGRYVIGHGAFQVGSAFISRSDLLSAAMPELRQLSERGVTGFLGILRDDRVIYMAAVQGSGPIAVRTEIGTAAFPHTTALGKVLIADLEEGAIRAMLGDALTSMTDRSLTSIEKLLEQLRDVRKRGYAINEGENRQGVHSIGAPVRDSSNAVIGAISGAVAIGSLDDSSRAELIDLVVKAGQRASQKLGYSVAISR